MPDYGKAKIYQIKNTIDDDIYVGSTCASLSTRMIKHRHDAKRNKASGSLYQKIKELGVDLFYIELIEEYPCNSKQELVAKEGHYIRERGTLNNKISGRTPKQYREEHYEQARAYKDKNREYLNECSRQYYRDHKDTVLSKARQPYTCECGVVVVRSHKSEHMKTQKHADLMKQKI